MAEHLSVGATGTEVARLHEHLQRHSFEVPASEVRRGFFGPGTREAVLACQRQHGLACSGEVDESTSALLNGGVRPPAAAIAGPATFMMTEPIHGDIASINDTGTGGLDRDARWDRIQLAPREAAATDTCIAVVSRTPTSLEVWWIGPNGSVQGAFWSEGSDWQRYELAPAGSASSVGGIAAVSRAPTNMEVWWIGPNGSVQGAFWNEGAKWQRYELAPAESSARSSGVAAVARTPASVEVWWIGLNASVQGAFWNEGAAWQRYEVAPLGAASPSSGIAALSRTPTSMEMWWIGLNSSVQGAYWNDGAPWQRYELAPAESASATCGIAAVSRTPENMEVWWAAPNGSVQGAFWRAGAPWQRYELAPVESASPPGGIAAVSRIPGSMDVWWVAPNRSVQGGFWNEGADWQRYELAPAETASRTCGIAAVSRTDTTIQVWWVGPDGSVQSALRTSVVSEPGGQNAQWVITGRVAREDQATFVGSVVLVSQPQPTKLGEDTADSGGHYTIRYKPPASGAVAVRVIAIDQAGNEVGSKVVQEPGRLAVVDLVVPIAQPQPGQRRVVGRVTLEQGIPAEGLTLRLYRLGFGGAEAATKIAETTTLAYGMYSLAYTSSGPAVNLEVRAVDPTGREVSLSKIIRSAGELETVNLVAPASTQPLAAEFTRLRTDVEPHLGATAEAGPTLSASTVDAVGARAGNFAPTLSLLAQAQEAPERQDLTVLREATGWDARLIATAAMAARLSAESETGLSEEAIYGLLRAGLPSDKVQLAQVSPTAVDHALATANTAGIIALDNAQMVETKNAFGKFSVKTRLEMEAPGSRSTYGDMLRTLDLSEGDQQKFANIYVSHRGDAKSLWDSAINAGLGSAVPTLQRQGKFAFLTTNNPVLTKKLMDDIGDAGPQKLVELGLYRKDKWRDLIDVVPSAFAGAADPKDAYATDMARKVRISYSTEVTWNMIDTGELVIEGGNANLSTFLKNAIAKGFKLGQTAIDAFVAANPGVFDGIPEPDRATTTQMVKTLQRVYQITPGTDAMKALLNAGLLSAQDVLAYPLDVFLERFGELFPSLEQATLVYRKAEQVSSITYSIFSLAKELDSAPSVFAMSSSAEAHQEAKNELIKRFPTMESLFGSLDFCECEHCRSVLSPAAYFVDLLQFLDRDPTVWQHTLKDWRAKHGNAPYPFRNVDAYNDFLDSWHVTHPGQPDPNTERTPYEILVERRPDLPHIPLTCENTNTALPHIDLVNEILEYFVAHNALSADAAHDTGAASTAELLAEPQYVIADAYSALQEARYPMSLPFDLWIETVRAFTTYFEVPLWRLLDTFRRKDDLFTPTETYDRAAIFFESLGLSPSEVEIYTDPNPLPAWFELYGYDTEANALTEAIDPDTGQRVDLNSAKALSRRLGVTYRQLVDIVQTTFVNPAIEDLALLSTLGVTISDARFYRTHKSRYEQNKDLIGKKRAELPAADQQRFDELTKKLPDSELTGWEVVNVVAAFESRLNKLAADFNTPVTELTTAIQNLPYDKVLVLADPDAGCNFDQTRVEYADGTKKVDGIALLRINLFVRLWRKLGWSIDETDFALTTFLPHSAPFSEAPADLEKQPLKTALIYLAHLNELDHRLNVGKQSRHKLVTLWSDIPTSGPAPLYAQLFLTHSVRRSAEVEIQVAGTTSRRSVFDDPLGRYLEPSQLAQIADQVKYEVRLQSVPPTDQINDTVFAGEARISSRYDQLGEAQYLSYVGVLTDTEKQRLRGLTPSQFLPPLLEAVQAKAEEFPLIKGHLLSLQGALGLTADEIGAILDDTGTSISTASLSLAGVSTLYRYGLLAKALKLSVRELIVVKQLSGIDPFRPLHPDPLTVIGNDHPFTQTLRFITVVEAVKNSGLKVADLDYLLRHRFDETGPYRPNRTAALAWLKVQADGVRAIRTEHAIPDDPGALSEEVLRQKLGLVLQSDVVASFLALMNGTAEATATADVASENRLQPDDFVNLPTLRVSPYNGAKGQQSLTVRGPMSDAQKADIKTGLEARLTAGQRAALAALLDGAQNAFTKQADEFFTIHLQKQPANVLPTKGFLDKASFDELLTPLPPISVDLPEEQQLAQRTANEAQRREKLAIVAEAFFPFLQRSLIRQALIQAVTAYTAGEPVLVENLLTDTRLISRATAPLLTGLEDVGAPGVSASFFESADLTGVAQQTSRIIASADTALRDTKDTTGSPLNPANSARFDGFLAVPVAGAYRFTIELERKDASAELAFEHLPNPVFLSGIAEADHVTLGTEPKMFLELKPGILYHFTLTLKHLSGGRALVRVEGETLPRGELAQLNLYPANAIHTAEGVMVLLAKALQLVQALGLTEREIRYLLTHVPAAGVVPLADTLRDLPIEAVGDKADEKSAANARFARFLRLAAYARLKNDLAASPDDLIGIFEADDAAKPGEIDEKVYPLIARLTRRDIETVKTTANALAAKPGFADEHQLARLWDALQVVERFGVPVAVLLEWARIVSLNTQPHTLIADRVRAAQRFKIAQDLKEALKARFDTQTWQRVAQPIFDKLRQRQRDVLVAYVMRRNGFDRLEQLFEFFLIDPGVEPVVQTSRIRSAIAAVQVFIHRCLLNLEPQVAAAAINSKQWQWMKRYPVWAGNRKLWLYPENVLEPEFRDDKTHLFTELEGRLLQGDVNNDMVEDAFLEYLKKLDELARLDIIALYCEEAPLDPASNRLHVIGRTYLQPYRYFYRQYAHDMWTPWEPVALDIESDHIVPVVWRDRLNLFWVTFVDEPIPNQDPNTPAFSKNLANISPSEITLNMRNAVTNKTIKVQLHWSEYFNGEWAVHESDEYAASLTASVPIKYDTNPVFIHATKEYESDGQERAVLIHLGGAIAKGWRVVSRNSQPTELSYEQKPPMPYNPPNVLANRYRGGNELNVTFTSRIETTDGQAPKRSTATPNILEDGATYVVVPCANTISLGDPEIATLVAPFFYQDSRSNAFFVEPTLKEQTIEEWQEWVTQTPAPESDWDGPDWWEKVPLRPYTPIPRPPVLVNPLDPLWRPEFDPRAQFKVDPQVDWLTNRTTVVQFGKELIGPAGRAGLAIQPAHLRDAIAEQAPAITVNAGSAIAPDREVVAIDKTALDDAHLDHSVRGLNVVGTNGLNAALVKNVARLNR